MSANVEIKKEESLLERFKQKEERGRILKEIALDMFEMCKGNEMTMVEYRDVAGMFIRHAENTAINND